MHISVHDLIGPFAITIEDGEIIHAQMHALLAVGKPATLDFARVEIVLAPFLNAAVGQLVGDFGLPCIRQMVTPLNLPAHIAEAWELMLLDSEAYYALDQAARDDVDEIVARVGQGI